MSKKILVVDDSSTVRHQVGAALRDAGFEVVEACDGVEGQKIIFSMQDLSMVFCDVNMPNRDGLSMVEAVLANPRTRHLPIVMLTTDGKPKLIDRAKKAGARGWIVKPFRADFLVAAAEKLTAA